MFNAMLPKLRRAHAQADVNELKSTVADVPLTGLRCRICLLVDPTIACDGEITDHKPGFLRAWSRKKWIIESRVRIVLRHTVIRGQLEYCMPQSHGFSIGVNCGESEYVRRQHRIPVDVAALLVLKNETETLPIRIFDVSPDGLGLLVPHPIPVDSCISVLLDDGKVFGLTRYCHKQGDMFRVGFATQTFIPSKDRAARAESYRRRVIGDEAAAAFTLATMLNRLTGH
jgi:hypothetical protein